MPTESNYYLYVLALEEGRYYVGITTSPHRRFHEHEFTSKGAYWLKKYRPMYILSMLDTGTSDQSEACRVENRKTLQLMQVVGWQSVRGGSFVQVSDKLHLRHLCNCGLFTDVPECDEWLVKRGTLYVALPYLYACWSLNEARIFRVYGGIGGAKEWKRSHRNCYVRRFETSEIGGAYRWLRGLDIRHKGVCETVDDAIVRQIWGEQMGVPKHRFPKRMKSEQGLLPLKNLTNRAAVHAEYAASLISG